MKKFSFLAMTTLFLFIGLYSCSNDDPAEPLSVDWKRTATIYGKILIDTNPNASPRTWNTPSEVSFTAFVPYRALNSRASEGYYYIPQDKITYDSSTGIVTVIAPVGLQGAKVTVRFSEFKGKVTSGGKEINVIWKDYPKDIDVFPGGEFYLSNWTPNYVIDTAKGDNILN
jgi:hypothetical protein